MADELQHPKIAELLGLSPEKLKKHAKVAQGVGIAFIILGVLAVLLPGVFSLGIELFLGWLLLISGIMQVIGGFSHMGAKGWWLQVLAGVLALIVGGLFIANPLKGVEFLTMFLAAMFFVNGLFRIFYCMGASGAPGATLGLINGIFGIIIGGIVWAQWPSSSAWFIGLLVGIDMLFFGITLLSLSSAVKKEGK